MDSVAEAAVMHIAEAAFAPVAATSNSPVADHFVAAATAAAGAAAAAPTPPPKFPPPATAATSATAPATPKSPPSLATASATTATPPKSPSPPPAAASATTATPPKCPAATATAAASSPKSPPRAATAAAANDEDADADIEENDSLVAAATTTTAAAAITANTRRHHRLVSARPAADGGGAAAICAVVASPPTATSSVAVDVTAAAVSAASSVVAAPHHTAVAAAPHHTAVTAGSSDSSGSGSGSNGGSGGGSDDVSCGNERKNSPIISFSVQMDHCEKEEVPTKQKRCGDLFVFDGGSDCVDIMRKSKHHLSSNSLITTQPTLCSDSHKDDSVRSSKVVSADSSVVSSSQTGDIRNIHVEDAHTAAREMSIFNDKHKTETETHFNTYSPTPSLLNKSNTVYSNSSSNSSSTLHCRGSSLDSITSNNNNNRHSSSSNSSSSGSSYSNNSTDSKSSNSSSQGNSNIGSKSSSDSHNNNGNSKSSHDSKNSNSNSNSPTKSRNSNSNTSSKNSNSNTRSTNSNSNSTSSHSSSTSVRISNNFGGTVSTRVEGNSETSGRCFSAIERRGEEAEEAAEEVAARTITTTIRRGALSLHESQGKYKMSSVPAKEKSRDENLKKESEENKKQEGGGGEGQEEKSNQPDVTQDTENKKQKQDETPANSSFAWGLWQRPRAPSESPVGPSLLQLAAAGKKFQTEDQAKAFLETLTDEHKQLLLRRHYRVAAQMLHVAPFEPLPQEKYRHEAPPLVHESSRRGSEHAHRLYTKKLLEQEQQLKALQLHDVVFANLYARLRELFPERSDAALYRMCKVTCGMAKRQGIPRVLEPLKRKLEDARFALGECACAMFPRTTAQSAVVDSVRSHSLIA